MAFVQSFTERLGMVGGCRWAGRGAVGYQQLCEDGFAVLGERLRSQEERRTVQEVLQKVLGVKVSCLLLVSEACVGGMSILYYPLFEGSKSVNRIHCNLRLY